MTHFIPRRTLLAAAAVSLMATSFSAQAFENKEEGVLAQEIVLGSSQPLSGTLACVTDWAGFNDYFVRMQQLGIVASMKDFYWDVRPKPEYGTVEIRVCDTPLDLLTPVLLAAYAQMLARECMESGWQAIHSDNYLAYSYNRFQACRFGLDAVYVDPADGKSYFLVPVDAACDGQKSFCL